eukprot:1475296-Rhodomonas_salina.1
MPWYWRRGWCYGCAMRCPVLRQRMLLHVWCYQGCAYQARSELLVPGYALRLCPTAYVVPGYAFGRDVT